MAEETTAPPRHSPVVHVRAAAPLPGDMTMMEMEQGVQASGDVGARSGGRRGAQVAGFVQEGAAQGNPPFLSVSPSRRSGDLNNYVLVLASHGDLQRQ